MIEGIIVRDLTKNVDERGYFAELLRQDWKALLDEDKTFKIYTYDEREDNVKNL